jgi:hypothetical protein
MSDASVSIARSIAEKFKGIYDIAGVAEALYWHNVKFQWRTDVNDFTGARTFYDMICVRRMTCYEFVHFCAYFAGQQRVASSGNPIVSGSDSGVYVKYSEDEWDPSSRSALLISRNRLVLGKAPFWNNQGGYFHVGICIGGAAVVSPGSEGNLNMKSMTAQFDHFYYTSVVLVDYNWRTAQNDAAGPEGHHPRLSGPARITRMKPF